MTSLTIAACLVQGSSALAPSVHACTAFALVGEDAAVMAVNYDNTIHEGLLFVNKRGVAKSGWEDGPAADQHARWTSRYGSVTFNLVMSQAVWGGMNETGLSVCTLFLAESRPPGKDARPWLWSSTWLQYVLDTCSSVDDVLATDSQVRVAEYADHYLICDRAGQCVTVEFLDGKMVTHAGANLPVRCLANDTYEESVRAWIGSEPAVRDTSIAYMPSLQRFRIAADRVNQFEPRRSGAPVDYAFGILEQVRGSITQWSIVFDATDGRIHFRTSRNPRRRFVNLSEIDFSCRSSVSMLDVHAPLEGDVTNSFDAYSFERHRDHAVRGFARWGSSMPRAALNRSIQIIDGFPCDQAQ